MDVSIVNDNAVADGGGGGGGEEFVGEDGAVFVGPDLTNPTLELLQDAVEERPDLLRATDVANGWTLLHHAVHRGWTSGVARFLLEARPELVRQRARNGGELPIHLVNRQTGLPVALLVARTWPEALHLSYEPGEEGDVPFFCAIKNRAPVRIVVLMFLWKYEPAFSTASADWVLEVLLSSVQSGEQFHAIDQYLQVFSRASTARDGELALFLALETHAEPPVLRFLQWAWPASIRERNEKGRNALHVAVIQGASHEVVDVLVPHMVVDLLVKWRPETARERDDEGCLPIHYVTSWQDQWPNAAQVLVPRVP
jgi:Ankyrin repeat